jgi:hypothetical protein
MQWKLAASEHEKHYELTGKNDKRAEAYAAILRITAKELTDFVSLHNAPSSATRRTGRTDCHRDAPAGFAAAHG